MELKSHSTHEEYCWHCDDVEPMTVAVNKGQEDQLTGNDGNDRWLAAYPRESQFRNKADCICFVYVCNRCGYPTVERRGYNHKKGALGRRLIFLSLLLTVCLTKRQAAGSCIQ